MGMIGKFLSVMLIPACATSAFATTTSGALIESLGKPNQAFRHELPESGGLSQTVSLPTAGAYVLEAFARNADLELIVDDGSGARHWDHPLERDFSEIALLSVDQASDVTVKLAVRQSGQSAGPIHIRLFKIASTARNDLGGFGLLSNASEKVDGRYPISAAEQIGLFSRAASEFERRRQLGLAARSKYAQAMTAYWRANQYQNAATIAEAAAAIYASADIATLANNAQHLRATSLMEFATQNDSDEPTRGGADAAAVTFETVLSLLNSVLTDQIKQQQHFDAARTINNIGLTHHYRGDMDSAVNNYKRAAQMFAELEEPVDELNPRANLSVVDFDRGRLRSARDQFRRLLALLADGSDEAFRADTLNSLAATEYELGQFNAALKHFHSALELNIVRKDVTGEARARSGLGTVYAALGEPIKARRFLRHAAQLRADANDNKGLYATLRQLGNLARETGDVKAAIEHHERALKLAISPRERSRAELSIAQDYGAIVQSRAAERWARRALASAVEAQDRLTQASALVELGAAALAKKKIETGLRHLKAAHSIYSELGSKQYAARSMEMIANAYGVQGDWTRALSAATSAIEEIDRARRDIADPLLRASYFGLRKRAYDTAVDILLKAAQASNAPDRKEALVRRALEVNERARARVLGDEIQRRYVASDNREQDSKRAAVFEELAELAYREKQLQEDIKDTSQDATKLQREMDDLEARASLLYENIPGGVRENFASVEEMQASLDANTVMLHYSLRQSGSSVWLIQQDAVSVHELPAAPLIEQAVRRVRASLSTKIIGHRKQKAQSDGLAQLARLILPNVAFSDTIKSVVVIPDGVTQFVPFGVLPILDATSAGARWVDRYTLSRRPCATPLRRDVLSNTSTDGPYAVVFANPDYTVSADSTSAQSATSAAPPVPLRPLPYSGLEADHIANLLPEDRLRIFTGKEADAATLLELAPRASGLIHIAAHAQVDPVRPWLSTIEMARDTGGHSAINLAQVQDLTLSADLVVLSACDTAIGKNTPGEGLIGPAHSFLSAGANGVIASLWAVPDRATSDLMSRFYKFLIDDGDSPQRALQRAQVSISKQREWSQPFYWASFVFTDITSDKEN